MLKRMIDYLLKYFATTMNFCVVTILLLICIVVLGPLIFIFGGIEAVLLAVKDDKLPFEY